MSTYTCVQDSQWINELGKYFESKLVVDSIVAGRLVVKRRGSLKFLQKKWWKTTKNIKLPHVVTLLGINQRNESCWGTDSGGLNWHHGWKNDNLWQSGGDHYNEEDELQASSIASFSSEATLTDLKLEGNSQVESLKANYLWRGETSKD